VLSSGQRNPVTLKLSLTPTAPARVRGALRDTVSPGADAAAFTVPTPVLEGHQQDFVLERALAVVWWLTPRTRGQLRFGDVHLRTQGPLGLCARQFSLAAPREVAVFPDLTTLSRDALALARASQDSSKRVLRRTAEGREFESLREYRTGDDRRSIDWKASARRARTMVRVHQPERNQVVLLLLDCGRHMAGLVGGRRKLDIAVDAALKVAKVSIDQGDLVGVLTFAREVGSWLPPVKGPQALPQLARALYQARAALEESDYGKALDRAFARGARRALVVVMTELLDEDTSAQLVRRTAGLSPRHLPLIASFIDAEVAALASREPRTVEGAHERLVAQRLEDGFRATAARLRDAGALVLRATPEDFGPAAVNAYLAIKQQGRL
jgi:uncharacterized protein (DUF58 family)